MPIVTPATLSLGAVPGSVSGAAGGTVMILASLIDQFALPITGATISFTVEGPGSIDPQFATTDDYGACFTTLVIPAGAEPGTTKIKANVFMTDIRKELDVIISE